MTQHQTRTTRRSADFATELRDRMKAVAKGVVPHRPWYVDAEDLIQVGTLAALQAVAARKRGHGWRWVEGRARLAMRRHIKKERRHYDRTEPLHVARDESTDGVAIAAMSQVARERILLQLDDAGAEMADMRVDGHFDTEIARHQSIHRNTVRNRFGRARENVRVDE